MQALKKKWFQEKRKSRSVPQTTPSNPETKTRKREARLPIAETSCFMCVIQL